MFRYPPPHTLISLLFKKLVHFIKLLIYNHYMNNKWEYKIISMEVMGLIFRTAPLKELNDHFNQLSDQGWEFIESQRIDTREHTDKILFIFKRLKA